MSMKVSGEKMKELERIGSDEAVELLEAEGVALWDLLARASAARRAVRGDEVEFCSIINAKSGGCPQDCAFCAQSVHNEATIRRYPLVESSTMVEAAEKAVADGARRFSIVTSGRTIDEGDELEAIAEGIERIRKELPLSVCASLGMLSEGALARLRDSGMDRYHHNLETARSHFSEICTTQSYEDSIETIRRAQDLGLSLCVGGLFGMGESRRQRVEMLETIRELDVESVPINFLNPIEGTRLEGKSGIEPVDCLRVVAVARLMMPEKEIRVCGGREVNLRDLQSWLLLAGVDGLMVGGYLTTPGREAAEDRQMVEDAGLSLRGGV
jgi:biotin synthase